MTAPSFSSMHAEPAPGRQGAPRRRGHWLMTGWMLACAPWPALAQPAPAASAASAAAATEASASAPAPAAAHKPIAGGQATRAWLASQASGEAASPHAQPLPGPAMQRAYARYLKTFEKDVPDKLRDDTNVSGKGQ